MGSILALDYGEKRTGIAVTDASQQIAFGLKTIPTGELLDFLDNYVNENAVETIVVGEPKQMNNKPSQSEAIIQPFLKRLEALFPNIAIERMDERFTSKMAVKSMVQSGLKKKQRRNKALIDEISATLILQSYLDKNAIG